MKNILSTILIPLNSLLLFFLLFDDQLLVPVWLQVAGRLHPLLLHFPIVLVLLYALAMLFLPAALKQDNRLKEALDWLLVIAAFTTVLTALAGIILSREGGYDADGLVPHKITGAITSFCLLILYFLRHLWAHRPRMLFAPVLCTTALVIWAGHLGANLTHGENFLLAPVTPAHTRPAVSFEDAFVYADLVEPIFEEKCMGCHNTKKAKGQLVMETKELLLKGGKNGKLWDTTAADLGLLMQRIHLPEEDKEHMPPRGKPQLTEQEASILYEWIKSGADFSKKVTDLPVTDTLRILASKVLKQSADEVYDFDAADEKQVSRLSNNNRVITPVAMESPALVVNFYNKPFFNSRQLEELQPLSTQIVELNLDNMPVSDADLNTIAQFINLRRLNLNFTNITGNNLNVLSSLQYLRSLSLSGTPVKAAQLSALATMPKLKGVYLWSTGVEPGDVASLLEKNKNISYHTGFRGDSTILQLTPPILENENFVLTGPTPLQLKHYIRGTVIRYTVDGTEPDSLASPQYTQAVNISSDVTIKAKAYKPGWLSSPVISQHFFKSDHRPDSAVLLSKVDDKYKAAGATTIIDGDKSDINFASGKWLGYRENRMEILLLFDEPVEVGGITLSMLQQIGAWIFPPQRIEVWGGTNQTNLKRLNTTLPPLPGKDAGSENLAIACPFPAKTKLTHLKLVITPVQRLPGWHDGKGEKGWAFIDEVFVH